MIKISGIVIGIVGAGLFIWHLVKVFIGADEGSPPFTHHILSLIGGVLMFAGIWIYVIGRRRKS